MNRFIDLIDENCGRRLQHLKLTELQQNLYNRCPGDEHPFVSNRHIIISGATTSGKTTVAEMLMVRSALLHGCCALYLAPTRALAQAKYRELRSKFAFTAIRDGIKLSTGEDILDDDAISAGRFSIACLVFEKTSTFLARDLRLLDRLGVVVVDEFHMVAEPERGARLEVSITKFLRRRRQQDLAAEGHPSADDGGGRLRIALISTEESADPAMSKFLATVDPQSRDVASPLYVSADQRPVELVHSLVLPGEDYETPQVHEFLRMRGSKCRIIPPQRIDALAQELASAAPSPSAGKADEASLPRLYAFLLQRLREFPTGRRILVLLATPRLVCAAAEALAVRIREDPLLAAREPFLRTSELDKCLQADDDDELKSLLRCCTPAGVLIHYSGIVGALRRMLEENFDAVLPAGGQTQIVLATKTLMYGLNMAISDVVFHGTQAPGRPAPGQAKVVDLTLSEFHNMAGRAGRLGKAGQGDDAVGRVYILVTDPNRPVTEPISKYYRANEPLRSQLHVLTTQAADDPSPAFKGAAMKSTAADEILVQCALDVLRYLSLESVHNDRARAPQPQGVQEMIAFLGLSLFGCQALGAEPGTVERFAARLSRTLESCVQHNLAERHSCDPLRYRITPLGEALIDTGTSLRASKEMPAFSIRLQERVWRNGPLPPEMNVLSPLVQPELLLPLLVFTPERRRKHDTGYEASQSAVLSHLETMLGRLGVRPTLVQPLARSVRDCVRSRKNLRGLLHDRYPHIAADAVLRLFCAILEWIEGAPRSRLREYLSDPALGGGDMPALQSWQKEMEGLFWKMLFLARCTSGAQGSTSEPDVRIGSDRRYLAQRLRHGVPRDALQFFALREREIDRREATRLLSAGDTPSRLLAGKPSRADPQGISERRREAVITNLATRASLQFHALFVELKPLFHEIRNGEALSAWLTDLTRETFHACARNFRAQDKPPTRQGERLREALVSLDTPTDSEGTVIIRAKGSGVSWQVRHSSTEDDTRFPEIRIVGVEFTRDWRVAARGCRFTDLYQALRPEQDVPHLVLVTFPWLPLADRTPDPVRRFLDRRARDGRSTVFLSPAALAILVTLVAGGFVRGESLMPVLVGAERGELAREVGLAEMQQALARVWERVPRTLHARLFEHFEVRSSSSLAARTRP